MNGRYLVAWKGRQTGPFSIEDIRSRLAAGELSLMHQIQVGGKWTTLDEFLSVEQEQLREKADAAKRVADEQMRAEMQQELSREQERARAELAKERDINARLERRLDDLERQRTVSQRPTYDDRSSHQGSQQAARRTSGMAIAALVMSCLNFVPGVNFISWILALVFGHIALSQINRDPLLDGRGMAMAGLIITYMLLLIGLAFGFFIGFGGRL